MKHLIYICLVLVYSLVFASCSDRNEEEPPTKEDPPKDNPTTDEPSSDDSEPKEISTLWTKFVKGEYNEKEYILPDFSYAGYAHGEDSIPNVKYKIFDVTNYGAVPNDGKSDRQALLDAIAAATQNGTGIIYFPSGRYDLRPKDASNEPIIIDADHIILRGAGCKTGGTELYMEYPNDVLDGTLWNTPELISFRYTRSADAQLATITGNAERGSHTIQVSSTGGLTAGQHVMIKMSSNDPEMIAQELAPYSIESNWTELQNGVNIVEYHEIHKISSNKVTFKEPLMHSIDANYAWTLHNHLCHKGNGVEDIAFVGNFKEQFAHHSNALHDSGFRMLTFWRQAHGWIRRCRFTDVSEALSVIQSGNVSVLDCIITGNSGHSAIRSQASSFILLGKINDQAGQFHTVGVSKNSSGTVLWRNTWTSGTCFESHASQPRATLIDGCEGGFLEARSGGDETSAPNHLRDLVIWNFNETDAGTPNINIWQRNTRWVMPVIVGFHGGATTFIPSQVTADEGHGNPLSPLSLYEAQLKRRLGMTPEWMKTLKSGL